MKSSISTIANATSLKGNIWQVQRTLIRSIKRVTSPRETRKGFMKSWCVHCKRTEALGTPFNQDLTHHIICHPFSQSLKSKRTSKCTEWQRCPTEVLWFLWLPWMVSISYVWIPNKPFKSGDMSQDFICFCSFDSLEKDAPWKTLHGNPLLF